MRTLFLFAIIWAYTYAQPLKSAAEVPRNPPTKPEDQPKGITDYGYGSNGAFVTHTQTLVDTDNYKVDGTAYASKNFHERTPLITGGTLDVGHKPSYSELNLKVENAREFGTKVGADAQYNFLHTQDGRGKIGVYGDYNRRYGGMFGTSNPQWGYGIRGSYSF